MHPDVAKKRKEKYLREVTSLEEEIGVLQQTHGNNHPLIADAMKRLALLHVNQHENTQAETTFRDALHVAEQNGNAHPRERADLLRQFASFLENTGRPDRAIPLRKRASEVEMNAFNVSPPIVPDHDSAYAPSTNHTASGSKEVKKPSVPEMPSYSLHAEFIDQMVGSASKTFWTEVLGGGALPLLLALWGTRILVTSRVAFYGYRGSMLHDPLIVEGTPAILFGWVWILVAAGVHFHYFWPYRNRIVCAYGKAISIVVALVMLFWSMYLITQL